MSEDTFRFLSKMNLQSFFSAEYQSLDSSGLIATSAGNQGLCHFLAKKEAFVRVAVPGA